MIDKQKAVVAATSREHRGRFSWLERSSDEYALRGTLDGYEVDELDGHDLAQFIPTIVVSEQGKQELNPENTE